MQKLAQISLKNTISVKLDSIVNQDVIIKNFQIIMECLKDLKDGQDGLNDKYKQVEKNIQNMKQNSNYTKGDQQKNKSDKDLQKLIKELQLKTEKQGQSILGNIKDISLLQKQMIQVKQEIQKLKLKVDSVNNIKQSKDKGDNNQSFNNINKQLNNNKQEIRKVCTDLQKMKQQIKKLRQDLQKLKYDGLQNMNQKGDNNISDDGLRDIKNMIKQLREKTRDLERETQKNKKQARQLNQDLKKNYQDDQNLKNQVQNLLNMIKNLQRNNVDQNMIQDLLDQIQNLKNRVSQLQRKNRINSKSSIQDKGIYTQNKFHKPEDDKIKQIINRLEILQKNLGNKHSIDDSKSDNKQKLPLIKRPKMTKERQGSLYEKSNNKKDMAQMKNELQAMINNYLNNMKTKDNFEELDLRIQQIRNALNKKADQQGMKKGLTFLQNKINQLYLFLTQPDGQDAMIVRKGFNCLSCSKKVEKLRGKLGPHINWNNMTSTNYSPPKVGYSRNMGDGSIDKEDDM